MKVCATNYERSELIVLYIVSLFDVCCNNCIRKGDPTNHFKTIYKLIGFLDTLSGREPASLPVYNDNSDIGSSASPKTWGHLRSGNRLSIRRRVLETWRYDCWEKNYQLCSFGPVGVMPDAILSKLASFTKIETIDDLLEAISNWGYATKYGHEVLLRLGDADREHQADSQIRRVETRQLNKKRKIEDLERDERQSLAGFVGPGLSAAPITLVHTRMMQPIVVKQVAPPTRPQFSRPKPRPISRPYNHTDIFDYLMGN